MIQDYPRASRPLNPQLYAVLVQRFGSVVIANEGQNMISANGPDGRRRISYSGEYYRICCPFCRESRHRLWINHMYGVPNAKGFPETSLAICFNEDCTTSNPNHLQQLEHMILSYHNRGKRTPPVRILQGETVCLSLGPCVPPGQIQQFDQLPDDHPAIRYAHERNFSPRILQSTYGVGYCPASTTYPTASNRWFIPITMYGQLVGWQARYLGSTRIMKYYMPPGMHKSRMLYNFDVAGRMPFAVLVEGVTKVWRVGAPAVALFGKTLSASQKHLLLTTWVDRPIFVLLDGDATDEADGIVSELARNRSNPVVKVELPAGREPDDYTTEAIQQMIKDAAAANGLELPT